MSDQVQLTDLDIITRYSIAVRSATADRDELLATLRADLAWLERGRPRSTTSYVAPPRYDEADAEPLDDESDDEKAAPGRAPIRRMSLPPARRAPAKRTTAKKTAAKTAAKKATTRRTGR